MKERKEKIEELRRQGKTYAEIGAIMGISRQRIHQIITGYKYKSSEPLKYTFTEFDFLPDIDHLNILKLPKIKKLVEVEYIDYSNCRIPTKFEGLDRVREQVRLRDNHICQKCFDQWLIGERRFDVHHLDEQMESVKDYKYDKANQDKMITLCHRCHLNLHTVRAKMVKNNIIRPDAESILKRKSEFIWFKKMGFYQKEIADVMGITPQSINRYNKKWISEIQ